MIRALDGVYFRIKRNDKWENICFSDLEPEEMDEVVNNKNDEWLNGLVQILLRTICEIRNMHDKEIFYPDREINIIENVDVKVLAKQLGITLHNIGDVLDVMSTNACLLDEE